MRSLSDAGKGVYKGLGVLMDMKIDGTDIFDLVQCSHFTMFLF